MRTGIIKSPLKRMNEIMITVLAVFTVLIFMTCKGLYEKRTCKDICNIYFPYGCKPGCKFASGIREKAFKPSQWIEAVLRMIGVVK